MDGWVIIAILISTIFIFIPATVAAINYVQWKKSKNEQAKKLAIAFGIILLISTGTCGTIFLGL